MVGGPATTATATTTNMLGTPANTNTTTTQETVGTITGLSHYQHSTTFTPIYPSDDESNHEHSAGSSRSESENSNHDLWAPSNDNTTLRLPSGKTIARRANGPHTSRHRHRRTPSPNTASHTSTSRKVHGNCAMIPDPTNLKTSSQVHKHKYRATPPMSDEEGDCDYTTLVLQHESSHKLLAPRVRLSAHRTTIRNSDAQRLSKLPASTQRTFLATSQKAMEGGRRAEQECRGKLDGYGNLKSKERFVNDVPGGKSHKNRFMAQ